MKLEKYNVKNKDHNDPTKYKIIKKGTVFDHTLKALWENESGGVVQNMCILYHDVGKIKTFEKNEGKISYHQHERVGAEMIEELSKLNKWDNNTRDAMMFCAKHHMKMHKLTEMKKSKIVKLMNSPYWDLLLKVSYVDDKCRMERFDPDVWEDIYDKIDKIEETYANRENDALTNIKKVVDGKMVMRVTGINKPCKEIGDIIKTTAEWIVNEDISLEDTEKIENFIGTIDIMTK